MKHMNDNGACRIDGEKWPCTYVMLAYNLGILWFFSLAIICGTVWYR